jgi:hypothetical protein
MGCQAGRFAPATTRVCAAPPLSTQVGHRAACEAMQEPDIQRSWAPTALRPVPSFRGRGALAETGRSPMFEWPAIARLYLGRSKHFV